MIAFFTTAGYAVSDTTSTIVFDKTAEEGRTRCPKQQFEEALVAFVRQQQPRREYLSLFREVVVDVWKQKQSRSYDEEAGISRRLTVLRANKTNLEEAYVYEKRIEADLYSEMRSTLIEEISLAEMELRDASASSLEIETVLDFAVDVVLNASNLWKQASLDEQKLQQVLFPAGIEFCGGSYRTGKLVVYSTGDNRDHPKGKIGSANGNRTRV